MKSSQAKRPPLTAEPVELVTYLARTASEARLKRDVACERHDESLAIYWADKADELVKWQEWVESQLKIGPAVSAERTDAKGVR